MLSTIDSLPTSGLPPWTIHYMGGYWLLYAYAVRSLPKNLSCV